MSKLLQRFILPLLILLPLLAQSQPFKRRWIDSVYATLSETERIGQLFMVAAYSGGPNANQEQIERLLRARQIGGVIFMQGTAEAQARLTNQYQQMSKVKLLIGMDAEWGLGMRLTGVRNFPRQMSIGATRDTAIMRTMAAAIADQCRRLGVHVNFAPVVDVNNNPQNPVINFRAFGDDKELVSDLGIAYMKGLQDNGIMACAKHFPGHGDVSVDSHKDLPIINKSKSELQQLELYPFKRMIDAGVQSMMIAHLSVPSLDNTRNLPTTLSAPVVTGLLRKEMGFNGLIFTDALDMKGVTKFYPEGEADLRAFLAGNDVLLFSQNVPLAIQKIQWAIKTGKASETDLEQKVKRILAAKYDAGLWQYRSVKENNATEDLNKQVATIRNLVARAAITKVKDHNGIVARLNAGKGKITYINVNGGSDLKLPTLLKKKYAFMQTITVSKKTQAAAVKQIVDQVAKHDIVIVGVHNLNMYPGKSGVYGLEPAQASLLQQLAGKKNVMVVLMGNPYVQKQMCKAGSLLVTYEDDEFTQEAAFDALTGTLQPTGVLPVKVCR
jgi:beta-N-acetylhexosaminidase